jgi:hypothetical protein
MVQSTRAEVAEKLEQMAQNSRAEIEVLKENQRETGNSSTEVALQDKIDASLALVDKRVSSLESDLKMGLDEIKTSMDKVIYEMAMAVSMMHPSRDSFSSDSNKLYYPGASTGLQNMNPQYSEPEVALGRGSLTPMATQELGSSQQRSRRPDMKGPKPSDISNILSICKRASSKFQILLKGKKHWTK